MTWEQYVAWTTYFQLEPWGEHRADLRNGILTSVLANVNRDSSRHSTPYTPEDFMPDFAGDRQAQPATKSTWETIKSKAKAYARGTARVVVGSRAKRPLPPPTP